MIEAPNEWMETVIKDAVKQVVKNIFLKSNDLQF